MILRRPSLTHPTGLPRILMAALCLAMLGPVLGAAPARAAAGLEADDPRGDVVIGGVPTPANKKLARSADIREVTAVTSEGRAVVTMTLAQPLSALKPGAGPNGAGAVWFLCTPATSEPDEPCDGTIVSLTVDDDVRADVDWQGSAAPMPACRQTAKVAGRILVVKLAAACVRLTDDVTVRGSIGARVGKPGRGGALFSDETDASRVGSL